MTEFELSDDDVLSWTAASNLNLVGTTTFKVATLRNVIKDRFISQTGNQNGVNWLETGISCELVDVSAGGGWKKGKIRLHLEFVPDEPEPSPDASFLDSLRADNNPQQ